MRDEFQLLDVKVQKWVYKQGWPDLREIQKRAIRPILSGNTDVLISASTAAGKTEAAFLPACTSAVEVREGFGILYVSPLKALINDQYRRLEELCELLDLPLTPWHGDSPQSRKNKAKKAPGGILLITPESLESLLIREPGWIANAFRSLKCVIIDEFHAFIGTERGQHLLSLLNRIEHVVQRYDSPIPRVALSATLGDLDKVPISLRPNQSLPCETITSSHSTSTLKVQVRGYVDQINAPLEAEVERAESLVCDDIYTFCRGDSHLVFANSRQRTESIAARLGDLCETNYVPNEFFPHHGSLSKDLREELESRLQKETLPTTAVCTMTLELGIDIGKVSSVIQVTAPHSVSSLRQRMGRSGRRNGPSILRMLITENELSESSGVVDRLRLELIQSLAMIRLLISSKWFEPADSGLFHFSTLLHQILATTAQWGGIRADQLFEILCKKGPFQRVSSMQFKLLLVAMGEAELITQLSSLELTLGVQGEKLVNHYTFYAVFKTPEEYRVVAGTKTLGSIPLDSLILPDQHIIFGGKRWKVEHIDTDKKVIYVKSAKGGTPPKFAGDGMSTHDAVRQEMFKILTNGDYRISIGDIKVEFADSTAKGLFFEAVSFFRNANLSISPILQYGRKVAIFTWLGDKVVNTLEALLISEGYSAGAYAGVIEVEKASEDDIWSTFDSMLRDGIPTENELAELVPEKAIEKYDEYLPDELLSIGYGRRAFDCESTMKWLATLSFRPAEHRAGSREER